MSMEDALDGIKSYYTANLEAALVSIESARSVTIPRWTSIETGPVKSGQYPNISIMPGTTAHEYGEIDEFLDPWFDHACGIMLAQQGSVEIDVQTDLIRYVEAISSISVTRFKKLSSTSRRAPGRAAERASPAHTAAHSIDFISS